MRSEWLGSTPIASSTGDGSMLSDEQADPEWTATPARSSPMSTGSASTPCTPRQTRWGRRPSAVGPTTVTSSTARCGVDHGGDQAPGGAPLRWPTRPARPRPARRPRRRRRGGPAGPPARRDAHALVRRRREGARIGCPRRTISAPAPGTPPSLCALMLTRSASSAARSSGTCPQAAAASTWTVTPASRHSATTSSTGWRVPTSWLPHWQCTRAGRGRVSDGKRSRSASTCNPSRAVHVEVLGRRQACRRVADGGMLHGGAQDGPARRGPGRTPDGGVDGLGGARGEDHLAPGDAHQIGDLARGPPRARHGRCDPLRAAGPDPPSAGRPTASARRRPRAAVGWCWRGRDRRAPRGLRQTRCRRRRPAPARRGSPAAPAAMPYRRARTAGP